MNPRILSDLKTFYPELILTVAILCVVVGDLGFPRIRKSVTFCLAALPAAPNAQALTLVADGKSPYIIVLPDQATVVEQTAARELQVFLEQVTGVNLPIRAEKATRSSA